VGEPKGYFGILSNAATSPASPRPTVVAITAATTIGMKERVLSSAKINSIANSTPPSGALNRSEFLFHQLFYQFFDLSRSLL